MKKSLLLGLILLIVTVSNLSSYASVSKRLTLMSLCNKSDAIIIGKVLSVNCFYFGDKKKKIYTSIKIQVTECLKGTKRDNSILEIIRYGGKLDGKNVFAVDMPTFIKGEETLLFLEEKLSEDFGENYAIQGMSQGKFTIESGSVFRDSHVPLFIDKNDIQISVQKGNGISKSYFINKINSINK